jgi:hypothetical protein
MMYAILNVKINFVRFFVQGKYINGKEQECRLAMRGVMNVGAVELPVHTITLSGNIQKEVMESSSALPKEIVSAD